MDAGFHFATCPVLGSITICQVASRGRLIFWEELFAMQKYTPSPAILRMIEWSLDP